MIKNQAFKARKGQPNAKASMQSLNQKLKNTKLLDF
jgi:hypothetical protein